MLRRMGWKGQHTGRPKPSGSPDNLYETLPGDPGAHGRFDDRSRESTAWTSLRLRRWLVGGTAVAAAGAAGAPEGVRARQTGARNREKNARVWRERAPGW